MILVPIITSKNGLVLVRFSDLCHQRCKSAYGRAAWLDQVHELALRIAVALDVALRRGEAGMPGKLLHIT